MTDGLLGVRDNDNLFAFLHDLHCLDDKILDDLLGVPDTVNALLDNGSVLSCDSDDSLADLPNTETAGPDPVRSIVFLCFWRAYAVTSAVYR